MLKMIHLGHGNKIKIAWYEFDFDMTPDFSRNWDRLRKGSVDDYDMWLKESEEGTVGNIAAKSELHMKRSNNCPVQVLLMLYEYHRLPNAHPSLSKEYRYLLTLSVTQVTCERSFSFLQFLKTRWRSTMAEERLYEFILIMGNYDIEIEIDNEKNINGSANHSSAYADILRY